MTRVTIPELPLTLTDVVVVGAGPTGLMAALVLARRGLRTVIIDSKAGPSRESRAIVVQARSMELYDQLGLSARVLDGAAGVSRVQFGPGAPAFGLEAAQLGATRFPGIHVFEQSRNEELLGAALAEAGGQVRWGRRLLDLTDFGEEGVEALVEAPDGLCRIHARWCIGADGASSTVRRLLGLPFDGVTDASSFCVADLHGVQGAQTDAISFRLGRSTFALLFPLGGDGHFRLIALVGTKDLTQDVVLPALAAELGLTYTEVDWFSSYRVHHRLAGSFRRGPVFLAGDAAHVHSPVGGQGMNTGLQDAHHLANLLADVAQGHLEPEALDTYERDRRPVARRLVDVTDRLFGLVARPGPVVGWLRRRAGGAAGVVAPRLTATPVAARLGGLVGQYRIRYHPVVGDGPAPRWADDPAVGLRLPPCADNHRALRAMTWQMHTYGAHADRPSIPEWIDGPFCFGIDPQRRLRNDRLYLVRPDGHVAASLPVTDGRVDEQDLASSLAAHRVRRTTMVR